MKVAALIGALAVVALTVILLGRGEDDAGGSSERGSGDLLAALRDAVPLPELETSPEPPPNARGPRYTIAQVRSGQEVALHESPGGEVVANLRDRTEFGSTRAFWVARVEGDWLGVPSSELENGQLGWIEDDRTVLDLFQTRYRIIADLSARLLELRYGKRVLDRFPVTVGSPASPTPPGEYSVTDGLAGKGVGPWYGCCILALSGHQPNLPPGWLGGDRIAIHGTPGAVGAAGSSGCLRASDEDMVALFARVPLGAPVFILA